MDALAFMTSVMPQLLTLGMDAIPFIQSAIADFSNIGKASDATLAAINAKIDAQSEVIQNG